MCLDIKTQILNLQAKTQQFIDLSLSDQSKVLCSLFTFSQAMTLEIINLFSSVQFLVASVLFFLIFAQQLLIFHPFP